MALDLFFVAPTPAFDALSRPDFRPGRGEAAARRKLVTELLAVHAGASLRGDALNGAIDGLNGEFSLRPGAIHWCLHHVDDVAPVRAMVDWFFARGLVCEDPQGAGFGNREGAGDMSRPAAGATTSKPTGKSTGKTASKKTGAVSAARRETLAGFDELLGAQFLGLRLERAWGSSVVLDWLLADGSRAVVDFVHFVACRVPDLAALVGSRATAVDFQTGDAFDLLRLRFDDGLELAVEGVLRQMPFKYGAGGP